MTRLGFSAAGATAAASTAASEPLFFLAKLMPAAAILDCSGTVQPPKRARMVSAAQESSSAFSSFSEEQNCVHSLPSFFSPRTPDSLMTERTRLVKRIQAFGALGGAEGSRALGAFFALPALPAGAGTEDATAPLFWTKPSRLSSLLMMLSYWLVLRVMLIFSCVWSCVIACSGQLRYRAAELINFFFKLNAHGGLRAALGALCRKLFQFTNKIE